MMTAATLPLSASLPARRGARAESADNLLGAHRPGIYSFLRRKGFRAEEADDLAQETLVRAFLHLDSFRGTSMAAWLYRIAGNLAVDHLRKRRPETLPIEDVSLTASESSDPLARMARAERNDHLVCALRELPEQYRQLLWLRYFEERSLDEIARATNCTPPVAKQRVFRALTALRKRWRTLHAEGAWDCAA